MAEEETGAESGHNGGQNTAPENEEFQFQTVGERLRDERMAQNKTLEDIAGKTRVPMRHLEAIEAANYDALPGRTYAVGFVKAYARAVNLSETELAGDLKDEMGYEGGNYHAAGASDHEIDDPSKIPSSRLAWMAALVGLLLVVGGYAVWKLVINPAPDMVLVDDDLRDEANASPGNEADQPADSAEDAAPLPPTGGEVVFIAKEEGIWVRFYEAEGERLYEDTMELGERFVLPADAKDPQVLTGRPDALAVTIGGQEVAPLSTQPLTVADMPIDAASLLARPAAEAGNTATAEDEAT